MIYIALITTLVFSALNAFEELISYAHLTAAYYAEREETTVITDKTTTSASKINISNPDISIITHSMQKQANQKVTPREVVYPMSIHRQN